MLLIDLLTYHGKIGSKGDGGGERIEERGTPPWGFITYPVDGRQHNGRSLESSTNQEQLKRDILDLCFFLITSSRF